MSGMGQSRPSWAIRATFRFPPDSDRTADIAGGPVRAKLGSRRFNSADANEMIRRAHCRKKRVELVGVELSIGSHART